MSCIQVCRALQGRSLQTFLYRSVQPISRERNYIFCLGRTVVTVVYFVDSMRMFQLWINSDCPFLFFAVFSIKYYHTCSRAPINSVKTLKAYISHNKAENPLNLDAK